MFSDLSMVYGMGTIEKMIEEEALKGKSGFSKMMAKRQVKKQSAANLRVASSRDFAGPSKTVFATGTALEMMSFGKDFAKCGGAKDFDTTPVDYFVLNVPSLAEILSSSFLRQYFENSFLGTVLSAAEITLYEALTEFYAKYSAMDSDKLMESQDDMKKQIETICDRFCSMLKNAEETKERAQKQKVILPNFFKPNEMELYADAHEAFAKALREKGWK